MQGAQQLPLLPFLTKRLHPRGSRYAVKKYSYRFVEHLGYVSLFPVILRLVSPDSKQLHKTLLAMKVRLTTPQRARTRACTPPMCATGCRPSRSICTLWLCAFRIVFPPLHSPFTCSRSHAREMMFIYCTHPFASLLARNGIFLFCACAIIAAAGALRRTPSCWALTLASGR